MTEVMVIVKVLLTEIYKEDTMGKNKSTKADGAKNFANTQDLSNKTRYPAGAEPNVKTSSPK